MRDRRLVVVFLAGWAALAAPAGAQEGHETEVEKIQNPGYRPGAGEKPDLAEVAALVVRQTNQFRKEQDRAGVEVNPKLAETASYFADYMARTDRFGHTADGNRPADRATKHGYVYCIILENIAYEYSSAGFSTEALAKGLVEGWKASPGHRRNMLDRDVLDTGVAVARSKTTGYFYAVQMFGRPRSRAIEFQIANRSDAVVHYRIGSRSFPLPPGYTRTHERCRPGELTVQLPPATEAGKAGAKDETRTFTPRGGEHFLITRDGGKLDVKKE